MAGSTPSFIAVYLTSNTHSPYVCFPSTVRNVAIGTYKQVFISEAVHVS